MTEENPPAKTELFHHFSGSQPHSERKGASFTGKWGGGKGGNPGLSKGFNEFHFVLVEMVFFGGESWG